MTQAPPTVAHELVTLTAVVARCRCGWIYRLTLNPILEDAKDVLMDAYNLHKEAGCKT